MEAKKPNKESSTQTLEKQSSSSTSSDHTDRDGVNWGSRRNRQEVRNVKDFHDSVVHEVVLDNNPERLRDMLKKGLFPNGKSIDGGTPLHRAAEIGSIGCADVLLEFRAMIDVKNLAGETPFHVAALNRQVEFGAHLLEKGAKNECNLTRRGALRGRDTSIACTKCRYLTQMINRQQQRRRQEDEEQSAQKKAAEEATAREAEKKREKRRQRRLRKKQAKLAEPEDEVIDLTATLAELKKEMGGPYLDKSENKQLKEEQRRQRKIAQEADRSLIEQHAQRMEYQTKKPICEGKMTTSKVFEPLAAIKGSESMVWCEKASLNHANKNHPKEQPSLKGSQRTWIQSSRRQTLKTKQSCKKFDQFSEEGGDSSVRLSQSPGKPGAELKEKGELELDQSNSGDETGEDDELDMLSDVRKRRENTMGHADPDVPSIGKVKRSSDTYIDEQVWTRRWDENQEELKKLGSSPENIEDNKRRPEGSHHFGRQNKKRELPELSDDDFADLDY